MTANLEMNLKYLRLPQFLKHYESVAQKATTQKPGLTYIQYLFELSQFEVSARQSQRVKNLLQAARFPTPKTLSEFNFEEVDSITQEQVLELCQGHFLTQFTNLIFLGTPGSGKSHLACAIGRELCLGGIRVLFTTGCQLVQELVKAKQQLALTQYFQKLRRYPLVIVDELGYIPFEKAEGDLLFQFISDRYERGSLMITTNLVFKEWDKIFKDTMTSSAAIDRLIHHSIVFEIKKEESFRTKMAKKNLKARC